ncbi:MULTISPECIES: DUF4250 domain-containing protein [Sellimonas]|uniref:DUF4250 domain-containing protein n=1 Tax=Sellimonas caecigallum TaxID=2592333 RepID=A0ABS7L906_9FIRM|nr:MULTISPECIES: DUF4250 domain-containing protein [Sellimonas]MBY0759581.1 DUF4250 domain-containing protein [Sellimonas caecigallum]OUP02134.1 DUF4250 domain-containing protein [Drancourtella sp. An210]OUP62887.1 DUF4250 domain-containing protein [Drancourtella sp. An177]
MYSLPKDPVMMLSAVNMKLRDYYPNLDAMCEDMGVEKAKICSALGAIDYEYDSERNQFV